MRYEKSCGTFTINNGKVLVIEGKSGNIGFPKGHVESNETEIQTAIRETKEETNIDVKVIEKYRYEMTFQQEKDMIKTVVYFIATTNSIDISIQEKELNKANWVELDKVSNIITYDNMKEVWEQALIEIKKLN